MQSDYSEIVPLEIGKDYDLPVIESFYVLLDISLTTYWYSIE